VEHLHLGRLEHASGCVETEMIGGIMKTTSRLALVAGAGILLGAAWTPAKAADLGGGCCGDLEERVAELEATTARKGNRVVSLQLYGQVNKALLIWDDGIDSDAYIVDHDFSSSRFGITGKATMKPGWTAGFLMEFDVQDSASNRVTQFDDEGLANELAIRQSNVWIESERLGRVTIGQGSTAADGAYEVNLANSLSDAENSIGAAFFVRDRAGSAIFQLQDFVNDFDGPRDDIVRYDSPAIYGFILSASWGDDDYADVALRFKKEFNSIRFAAAIAYQWDSRNDNSFQTDNGGRTNDQEIFGGSASVMHIPTGLFLTFMGMEREVEGQSDRSDFWLVQGGIERKWLPYGNTTIYAEYGHWDDISIRTVTVGDASSTLFNPEAERLGFGVVQKFDSAALEIYAQAYLYSFEGDLVQVNGGVTGNDFQDLSFFMIGSRIKF
jgi:predicted porin